jgi:hypothetical protein
LEEEVFDVLIFYVFALGEDAEDRQGREVGDLAQFIQDLGNIVFLSEVWLHEVFECMDPKVNLIITVLLTEFNDVLVSVSSNVEVQ